MNYNNVEEFVNEEFVNAYLQATNQNTPDLWSRIETGFEVEARDIIVNQKVKSARLKKTIGFVAAAALITIVAVPVMMMGMGGKKSEEMYTESTTVAEQEIHYDEAADSVAMESATEAASDSANSSAITSNQSESLDESAALLKDIEGIQTDDRQIVVEGEFLFDSNSNEVSFKIKTISDNQYKEYVIDIGDKIKLSNSMYILSMDVLVVECKITLDSVKVDEVGNITGRIINFEHLEINIEK